MESPHDARTDPAGLPVRLENMPVSRMRRTPRLVVISRMPLKTLEPGGDVGAAVPEPSEVKVTVPFSPKLPEIVACVRSISARMFLQPPARAGAADKRAPAERATANATRRYMFIISASV